MNAAARLAQLARGALDALRFGPAPPALDDEPGVMAMADVRPVEFARVVPSIEETPYTTAAQPPYGGWMGWEHAHEHAPTLQPYTLQRMLREDPVLYGVHRATCEYMASEDWAFQEGRGAESGRYAEFLNTAFGFGCAGRARVSWDHTVKTLQTFVEEGVVAAEVAYYIADDQVWFDQLLPIDRAQITRWEVDPRSRQLLRVHLHSSSAPLPAHKAAVIVHDRSGIDFWGRSVLRACYPWWQLKRHVLWLIGGGCERWSLPTPLLDIDRRVAMDLGYTREEISQMISEGVQVAAGYAAGRTNHLRQNPAVSMKVFGADKWRPEGLLEVVRVCDLQMLSAWSSQHSQVGLGEIGSKSAGELHEGAFRITASGLNDQIADVIGGRAGPGRGIAERLLAYNIPGFDRSQMPKLKHWGLIAPPIAKLLPHIPHLINSAALTPDADLERALRSIVALATGAGDRPASERLAQPNNLVEAPGKQITPDGMPARPGAQLGIVLGGRL